MKYGNIYKVLIMAVLAAIILSLSMRLFKNPEESKEPIVQPETAAELTEEDITAETERNQTTMATYCLLYTSPSPRDISGSRMPSSA